MRWGIAWSFTQTIPEKSSSSLGESGKKSKPLFLEPSDEFYFLNNIPRFDVNMSKLTTSDVLMKISAVMSKELTQLHVEIEQPARILLQNKIAYEIIGTAYTNTWTHQ